MNLEDAERSPGQSPTILLAALILLAFVLRFWRVGHWGFDSDELFMLQDSLTLQPRNPRPLMYLLNHYLLLPFMPLDEFGLRALPALFGVLGIPAFYLAARRLVGTRAALFGAFLLTFSALHVYYSQFARYWTLVFLLSSIYPYAIYVGIREKSPRALALGLLTAVLALLAHPASVLLFGGLGLWMVATYLRRDSLHRLWSQKSVRWAALLVVLVAVMLAVRFVPLLQAWINERDRIPRGEFLLRLPVTRGVKQVLYLSAFVEGLTLPLVLTGALGIYLLWRGRDRSLAVLLTCLFLFPVAFLVLLSFRTPVSTFYLVPTTPVLFMGAGVFLDRLAAMDSGVRPRWMVAATVAVITVAAGAPTLISQYRDGRRYDFRGAARWLDQHAKPGDVIFSDQAQVMTHYLHGPEAERLVADSAPLIQSVRQLNQSGGRRTLWIVVPHTSRGSHRTNPKIGSLNTWIYENCQLSNVVGVARLDFRINELQIFRCTQSPPSTPAAPPT